MELKDYKILIQFIAVFLLVFTPVWLYFLVPEFEKIPYNFEYKAEITSIDNFYDEETQSFSGAQISKTKFSYKAVSKTGDVLIIDNLFAVAKQTGELIFQVEREYGINARTGEHIKGYGDRSREGYLFAPKNLQKQDYVYWHINYDEPATMKFQNEEIIDGLLVYRYESNYHSDQTRDLGHLPGVPEERGINLDINLQTWIEPVTGRFIKYKDNTTAYYYDIRTGERLHPWNRFSNTYTDDSIKEQVSIAKKEKIKKLYDVLRTLKVCPSGKSAYGRVRFPCAAFAA